MLHQFRNGRRVIAVEKVRGSPGGPPVRLEAPAAELGPADQLPRGRGEGLRSPVGGHAGVRRGPLADLRSFMLRGEFEHVVLIDI